MRYRVISTAWTEGTKWQNQQVASFHDRENAVAFFDRICLSGYVLDTLNDTIIAERG